MNLAVLDSPAELATTCARLLADHIRARPDALLLAPTGNTPVPTYHALATAHAHGSLPTDHLRIAQLDEYLGIGPDDPRSFYGWLRDALLDPLDISADRIIRLHGDSADPEAECDRYNRSIRAAGGLDLALLGLGTNGHIGFNEPPSDPSSPTRVVTLTPRTVSANAAYWGGENQVPRRAITAGMNIILSAQAIILLVSGESKRAILHQVLHGPLTSDVPASFLRTAPHVTVLADRAAHPLPQ